MSVLKPTWWLVGFPPWNPDGNGWQSRSLSMGSTPGLHRLPIDAGNRWLWWLFIDDDYDGYDGYSSLTSDALPSTHHITKTGRAVQRWVVVKTGRRAHLPRIPAGSTKTAPPMSRARCILGHRQRLEICVAQSSCSVQSTIALVLLIMHDECSFPSLITKM